MAPKSFLNLNYLQYWWKWSLYKKGFNSPISLNIFKWRISRKKHKTCQHLDGFRKMRQNPISGWYFFLQFLDKNKKKIPKNAHKTSRLPPKCYPPPKSPNPKPTQYAGSYKQWKTRTRAQSYKPTSVWYESYLECGWTYSFIVIRISTLMFVSLSRLIKLFVCL